MTIRELGVELQNFPSNLPVVFSLGYDCQRQGILGAHQLWSVTEETAKEDGFEEEYEAYGECVVVYIR